MISKLLAVFALTIYIVAAQTSSLSLPVTQDFAVSNNGYSGAQISLPNALSFFNNGFQSSVAYFGIDLSPLAVYDVSTISSATLTFTNYTVSQGSSASVAITLLNYGQVFDESTVTLNTQPTSQGSLGSATFSSGASATIDVTSQLSAANSAGGLFGFRVDPPGGPVSVASHRVNPNAVYIAVVFGGTTTTQQATTTTTTTVAPVPSTNSPGSPTTTTTTSAPTTTPANCWTCGSGWVHWYSVPGMTQPGSDPCACIQQSSITTTTTTTKAPASGSTTTTTTGLPTSSFSPSGSSTTAAPGASSEPTDAPRSSASKASAVLLCIVPLALALLL